MSDDEISALKSSIDLRAFAAAHGFFEDPKDKWAGHQCFRNSAGEKIYVSRKDWGWFYWSAKSRRQRKRHRFLSAIRIGAKCSGCN